MKYNTLSNIILRLTTALRRNRPGWLERSAPPVHLLYAPLYSSPDPQTPTPSRPLPVLDRSSTVPASEACVLSRVNARPYDGRRRSGLTKAVAHRLMTTGACPHEDVGWRIAWPYCCSYCCCCTRPRLPPRSSLGPRRRGPPARRGTAVCCCSTAWVAKWATAGEDAAGSGTAGAALAAAAVAATARSAKVVMLLGTAFSLPPADLRGGVAEFIANTRSRVNPTERPPVQVIAEDRAVCSRSRCTIVVHPPYSCSSASTLTTANLSARTASPERRWPSAASPVA